MSREEILKEIEALAHGMMSRKEISKILEFEIELFQTDKDIDNAFEKGWLKSKYEINRSIQSQAASGSGPAQEIALKRLDFTKQKDDE